MIVMFLLIQQSMEGVILVSKEGSNDPGHMGLHIMVLVFCFVEYALWYVSCFWIDDVLTNPYNWLDALLTVCYVLFVPMLSRAVDK